MERKRLDEQIASKGVRLTAQRRAVIASLQEADVHLDAATLLERARQRNPNIDRATVYRTLELLKKLGLIDELDLMHLEGEKHYFEAKSVRGHFHLACFTCGAIVEYTSSTFEQLKQEITSEHGFEIQVVRLEVGGQCEKCRRLPRDSQLSESGEHTPRAVSQKA